MVLDILSSILICSRSSFKSEKGSILQNMLSLIRANAFEQALEELQSFQKLNDSQTLIYREIQLIESIVYINQNLHVNAKPIIEQVLQESRKNNYQALTFDALLLLADFDRKKSVGVQGLKLLDEAETLLPCKDLSEKDNKERKALLYQIKGRHTYAGGDNLNAIKEYNKALELFEELNESEGILEIQHYLAVSHMMIGNLNKAFENYSKSLRFSELNNNTNFIIKNLQNLGNLFNYKGEFKESIQYNSKSLEIAEKNNNSQAVAFSHFNLGRIYVTLGQKDEVFKHLELALKYFKSANDTFYTLGTLYFLFKYSTDENLIDEAKKYNSQMVEITSKLNKVSGEIQTFFIDLPKGMMLKSSKRLSDKYKALEIFKNIVSKTKVEKKIESIDVFLYYIDLLFLEFKITGEKEVLDELIAITNELLDYSMQLGSFNVQIEVCLIQSQLSLLDLNVVKAKEYLIKAQEIAEVKDLQKYAIKISNQIDILLEKEKKWQEMASYDSNMSERIELAQMDELLTSIVKRRMNETLPMKKEEPYLLLCLTNSGIALYSKNFSTSTINDQLLAGFITAVNSFSSDALSVSGSLERIKHQEYTIILKYKESFVFCYIFKGASYNATKKLEEFISEIYADSETWELLITASKLNKIVDKSKMEKYLSFFTKI